MAQLPLYGRWALKLVLGVTFLLIIIFPRPVLFFRQISRYTHPERLIDPDFQGIHAINSQLDSLQKEHPDQDELKLIQYYIYSKIEYVYDWDQWHNSDYWASPAETWQTRQEDCDGQAILAVSIMQSRGYDTAQLGINLLHIWAKFDTIQMMDAMQEENIRKEAGKVKLRLPSVKLFLQASAYLLGHFPATRLLLILFIILGLAYHPESKLHPFLGITIIALLGFIMLRDWAIDTNMTSQISLSSDFILGIILMGAALISALCASKMYPLIKKKFTK